MRKRVLMVVILPLRTGYGLRFSVRNSLSNARFGGGQGSNHSLATELYCVFEWGSARATSSQKGEGPRFQPACYIPPYPPVSRSAPRCRSRPAASGEGTC